MRFILALKTLYSGVIEMTCQLIPVDTHKCVLRKRSELLADRFSIAGFQNRFSPPYPPPLCITFDPCTYSATMQDNFSSTRFEPAFRVFLTRNLSHRIVKYTKVVVGGARI